ncbi:porin family protein [Prosthecochloris sp. N3]|uniref:Porin family protein n=2 Tax=Prosthecochloris ethylica TaxID=2743976 RepID=A0ABR9XRA0_9CHLB|nr:outer membrane beta-barrel protein [Prosthecochloris ethylica]MBF0586360.1 porin family protein [Prosthecochloris ethylica]MBF0636422.1 porin family protein [Prosthecochloris ethylica]NUK47596.1 porin family protein [Prosthecochloris ethylica]
MKKTLSLIMVFVAAVMWSTPGFSGNAYVSGNVGISWLSDSENRPHNLEDIEDCGGVDISYGSGLSVIGAAGYDFGDIRVEGELGYQSGDIESVYSYYDEESYEGVGDVDITSLMVNVAYDISLGNVEVYPFVGVGGVRVSFDEATLCGSAAEDYEDNGIEGMDQWYLKNKNQTSFAYQIGAGVALPVADDIMVDARYRYFDIAEFALAPGGPAHNVDMASHSAMLGLRVAL